MSGFYRRNTLAFDDWVYIDISSAFSSFQHLPLLSWLTMHWQRQQTMSGSERLKSDWYVEQINKGQHLPWRYRVAYDCENKQDIREQNKLQSGRLWILNISSSWMRVTQTGTQCSFLTTGAVWRLINSTTGQFTDFPSSTERTKRRKNLLWWLIDSLFSAVKRNLGSHV